ncbi:hypothetical protein LPJ57_008577, partial [Coemansia sp. RSA 486]
MQGKHWWHDDTGGLAETEKGNGADHLIKAGRDRGPNTEAIAQKPETGGAVVLGSSTKRRVFWQGWQSLLPVAQLGSEAAVLFADGDI